MDEQLILKNRLKVARAEKGLSQSQLAEMVGVSRNTISSIETGPPSIGFLKSAAHPNRQAGADFVYCAGQEV